MYSHNHGHYPLQTYVKTCEHPLSKMMSESKAMGLTGGLNAPDCGPKAGFFCERSGTLWLWREGD